MKNSQLISMLINLPDLEVVFSETHINCCGHAGGDERCYCDEEEFRYQIKDIDQIKLNTEGFKIKENQIVITGERLDIY